MTRLLQGLLLAALAATMTFATGCGNVCDDAADICGAGDAEDGGECEGAAEEFSQCIVDADDCSAETVLDCAGGAG